MKILLLAESLDPRSGWGAYAHALAGTLRAAGEEVTVLTAHGSSDGPHLPDQHASWFRWRLAEFRLHRWLSQRQYDVVHVTAEVYAQLFRAWGSTPFVVTVHGTYADPDAYPAYATRTRAAFHAAQTLVAVSAWTRSRVPREFQEKVQVIPNGVDMDIADEPFDAAPAHGRPLVLSVGAIKPRKGLDRLIAGFAEFQKTHPEAELVIIGRVDRPDVQHALVRQANDLGLADHVRFAGEVSRRALLGWFRACDVFVLTPVTDGGYEGFGLVYLEANVFGKPCVGSRDSGARDSIQEGKNGFLAEPNDPADIARAIDRAYSLSPESVQQTMNGCDWKSRAHEYRDLYGKCRSTPSR